MKFPVQVLCLAVVIFALFDVAYAETVCTECDSSKDTKCITDWAALATAKACATNCFTRVENGVVTRGCLSAEEDAACKEPSCRKCPAAEKQCNTQRICKQCNSATDPKCAQTDATADAYNAVCEAADTKCQVMVNSEKQLERACAISGHTCVDKATCDICEGPNCNAGIFPADRRQCYQCSGAGCNADAKNVLACQLYAKEDKCFWYGNAEANMTRGCLSDADATVNVCGDGGTAANVACSECATDKCNSGNYMVGQTLKCLQCSDAEACQKEQKAEEAVACKKDIVYSAKGACYTQMKDNNTHRGCLYDRDESVLGACTSANNCVTCDDKDGCNMAEATETQFTCIRCRSDEEKLCAEKADKLVGSTCTHAIKGTEEEICYYGTWYGVVTRGCLVDADERMSNTCRGPSDQCTTCNTTNCNTPRSGAAIIWGAGAVLLSLVAFMLAMA